MQSDSVENIFARAWTLLTANPVIVVPGLIVGLVVGIINGAIAPHPQPGDPLPLGSLAVAASVSLALGILAFLVTQTYTTGMAGAAWQTGIASLDDGRAAFRQDAGRLLAAVLLIAVVGIAIAVITLGIGWFVVLFFAMYIVPAVVLENRGAAGAFRISATIARRRALSTIIIIVMLFVIGLVVGLLALPLHFVPFIGPIVVAIVTQAVTAYATLVIVGEYLSARRAADTMSVSSLG